MFERFVLLIIYTNLSIYSFLFFDYSSVILLLFILRLFLPSVYFHGGHAPVSFIRSFLHVREIYPLCYYFTHHHSPYLLPYIGNISFYYYSFTSLFIIQLKHFLLFHMMMMIMIMSSSSWHLTFYFYTFFMILHFYFIFIKIDSLFLPCYLSHQRVFNVTRSALSWLYCSTLVSPVWRSG